MANETVSVPLDNIDRLGELLEKSIGMADVLHVAGENGTRIEPLTIARITWSLRDMLIEARGIVGV